MSRNLGDAPIFVAGAIRGNHGKCLRVCERLRERERERDVRKSMERFWDDGMTEREEEEEEARVGRGEDEKMLRERGGHGRRPWCDLESA